MGIFDMDFASGDYNDSSGGGSESGGFLGGAFDDLGFESIGGDSPAEGDVMTANTGGYSGTFEDSTLDGFYNTGLDWLNGAIGVYEKYQNIKTADGWQNGQINYAYPEQDANPSAQTGDISGIPRTTSTNGQQAQSGGLSNNNMLMLGAAAVLALVLVVR